MKLVNYDNDNYVNSVLVMLYNNPYIKNMVYNPEKKLEKLTESKFSLLSNIRKLFEYCDKNGDSLVNPVNLKKCINENFIEELVKKEPSYIYEKLVEFISGLDTVPKIEVENLDLCTSHFRDALSISNNYPNNIYGQYIKKCTCSTCSKKIYSYDIFQSIKLDIFSNGKYIEDVINDNFEEDFANLECSDCSTGTDIEFSIEKFIFKMPDYLSIKINRFNNDSSLRECRTVKLKPAMDIGNYVFSNSSETSHYILDSVLCVKDKTSYIIVKNGEHYEMIHDGKVMVVNDLFDSEKHIVYIAMYSKKN